MSVRAPQRRATWQDAYDSQMGLWRWYRTRDGQRWLQEHARYNMNRLPESAMLLMKELYAAESWRLLDLDPIFVSGEMCDVIEAAYPQFDPEPLLNTDLMTPRGFLYFERPFDIPDRFDTPTTIAAISWTRMFSGEKEHLVEEARERMNAMDASKGDNVRDLEEEFMAMEGVKIPGIALTLYTTPQGNSIEKVLDVVPPLIPMHLTPWYFDMTFDGNEVDTDGVPTGAGWWWRILQTTFRLMQQRIAVKHMSRPDRASRRAAKDLGVPHEAEVVVVRLRREASESGEPTGEEANYSHRFIVSGHWRNQWYPSAGVHRQIWISPYVKGDPGLPLIVRPRRVYTWDR